MGHANEDKNDAIMQRRIEQEREDPHLHKTGRGEEARSSDLDARHTPESDRRAGYTRRSREPFPGEVIGNKEPPFEVVGLDALSPLLGYVQFPATREDIEAKLGDVRIPISKERTKTVREMLDDVGPTTFDSNHDVERAVKASWAIISEREGRGSRHQQNDDVHRSPTRNSPRDLA